MRVFVDTNVWIAALIARGTCAELIEHLIADHCIWSSPFIRDEIRRVLRNKFNYSQQRIREVIEWLDDVCQFTDPVNEPPQFTPDRDDDYVLQAALDADAQVLVTGDSDLLDENRQVELTILRPADFWKIG